MLHRPFRKHMVKSLGFTFDVFAKDLYTILASIKYQRILNLSVSTCAINTKSRGNVAVDSFRVGSFRNKTTIKFCFVFLLGNPFEVRICGKGNFKLVLSTIKSHKRILFGHVYPNCFIVYAIFIVFVPGFLAVKSLKAVQAEVLLVSMATIATSK